MGAFLDTNVAFSEYATDCDVALNFEEFCFVAEDDGVGSKLVEAVENVYKDKSYDIF